MPDTPLKRCGWVPLAKDYYVRYHDEEWGTPVHDEHKLFEAIVLQGAQAGLSWETILKKREEYRVAFDGFDPCKVAAYRDDKVAELLANPGIVRNRLKVASAVRNAEVFLAIQKEFGSFDSYLWGFVDGKPVVSAFGRLEQVPASSELSGTISADLKKRGMKFVGTTIIYALLQACGVVNDHLTTCFRFAELTEDGGAS